jgi:hypothetical protein
MRTGLHVTFVEFGRTFERILKQSQPRSKKAAALPPTCLNLTFPSDFLRKVGWIEFPVPSQVMNRRLQGNVVSQGADGQGG